MINKVNNFKPSCRHRSIETQVVYDYAKVNGHILNHHADIGALKQFVVFMLMSHFVILNHHADIGALKQDYIPYLILFLNQF